MLSKIHRFLILSTLYSLLSTLLIGCATVPTAPTPALVETMLIDGTNYVSCEGLSRAYNLHYHRDSITKRVVLSRGDNELRVMADSSIALLNEKVLSMGREAKFCQDSVFIPQSFVKKRLLSLFEEKYKDIKSARRPTGLKVVPVKTVIIDPGHGGKDPGAVGRGGLKEKDVALDISKKLKNKLNALGIEVIMTRQDDTFVSLAQRSKIANKNSADFFVSIHANAARSRGAWGVEVFYLSEDIDDNLRCLKAAQNYSLDFETGYSGEYTLAIIWDLIYSENRRSSSYLAEFVCRSLSNNLSQRNRGVKPARFYVLKGTNIPAILVEVGFISNSSGEKKLRSIYYRDEIADAIVNGIVQYNRNFTQQHTVRF